MAFKYPKGAYRRFRLDMKMKFFTMRVARGTRGCAEKLWMPHVQDQVGWAFGNHGLVGGVSAHGRGMELNWL